MLPEILLELSFLFHIYRIVSSKLGSGGPKPTLVSLFAFIRNLLVETPILFFFILMNFYGE